MTARRLAGLTIVLALAALPARAAELIVGEARAADDAPMSFSISGKSRDDVLGGELALGEARYVIARVSQRGMIGAHRMHDAGDGSYGEFAVFSSSFSEQTAVGQPWPAAGRYHRCDEPYNSFLAVYRINGKDAVTALGQSPYPTLMQELERSDAATVYCFMSRKAPGSP